MNSIRAIAAFIMVLVLMSQISVAQIDRTKRPEAAPPPKAVFPHFEEFTLNNGLKVYLIPDERPSITFRLLVRGGNGADGDIPGLADAVAELMTKGTTSKSAQQFASEIDFVGGAIGAGATADALSVTASGLKKHMDRIVALFAAAITNPSFPVDEIQKYQEDQTTALQSNRADPSILASYAVNKVLYGDTPYGRMPTEESIGRLNREAIADYHKTYVIPNNATLAVVGSFTKNELKASLEKAFAGWKAGQKKTLKKPTFPSQKGRRVILVDRPASVQSAVRVLCDGPAYTSPDRQRAFILNSILGGGSGLGNRLTMNLRETHSYTYSPYSAFEANLHTGNFMAVADVRNSVTDSAITEILHEIEQIKSTPVPADELELNLKSATGNYLMSLANPSTTALRVQSIEFYGLPKDYYDKLVSSYTSTKPGDISELAKKYLKTDNLAIVVVGKASEIKDGLAQFGTVEVWDTDLRPVVSGNDDRVGNAADVEWDKMIKAMGGEKALKAVKSIKTEGTINTSFGAQKITGQYLQISAYPNKLYRGLVLVPAPGQELKIETYVDGKNATNINPGGKQVMQGDELQKQLEGSHILSEAYFKERGGIVVYQGERKVEGVDAIVLQTSLPSGGSRIYYIDQKTFLPIKTESSEAGALYYKGWKDVDGVKLPSAIVVEQGGGIRLEIADLIHKLNVQVADSAFIPK